MITGRWKHRIGIASIVIGGIFLLEWARSGHFEDDFRVRIGRSSVLAIHSYHRCVGFFWLNESQRSPVKKWNGDRLNAEFQPMFRSTVCEWSSSDIQGQISPNREGGPTDHVRWTWEFMELRTGTEAEISESAWILLIPYWAIIPPLFFLAACIYFFKPRPFGAPFEPRVEYE